MNKGAETREQILTIAEAAVLDKGFSATSIDEIIAEAGITKSGFFYHFKDKNQLAREMVQRFVVANERILDDIFGRSRELSDDPLQSLLIGLKLLAETLADVQRAHPGCILASICYQERLFDREVVELTREFAERWNARFRGIWKKLPRSTRRMEPNSTIWPRPCSASSMEESSLARLREIQPVSNGRCWHTAIWSS